MADDISKRLYPGFSGMNTQGPRLQRLETGAQRLQGNVLRPTTGQYARVPKFLLDSQQNITLTSTSVAKRGGVSITGNISGFAYVSTGTSITWYWDGTNGSSHIVITRADGTRFTVPTAGSELTVTGLTPSTTYYFLPYWNVLNTCNMSWVQGTVGSPQIAFVVADTTDVTNTQTYLMQQTLQGNEPLTAGFMTAATTSGGPGGGGGGGGGGAGKCVMAGTDIVTLGGLEYSVEVHGNNHWVSLRTENGNSLWCTPSHPLYCATRGKIDADKLVQGDIVITDTGEQELTRVSWSQRKCSLWKVIMPKGHLYWANGFLSHNAKQAVQ